MSSVGRSEGDLFLPIGTVTLLLADVEGSTRLWETVPEAMTQAVARLDEVVAEVIGAHGGVRPVEQGEGDSFVAAFSRGSDAVACALALQRSDLAPIRLRIGIHTGEVQLRDQANYVGSAVNRTARVRELAHGGQALLSQACGELVVDHLPMGVTLLDLGSHRLRDLARPERIFQLCHPDLAEDFPPLRSLDIVPNNLPVQLTSFIGRQREIDRVGTLLAENRLVTLTGSGGCGKTRLALQVAADQLDAFRDGVWWIDLAPVADPALAAGAVASALSIKEVPLQSMVDTVRNHLAHSRALLLLDNCEHLVSACAELAQHLLQGCPSICVLATSREPLGLPGEVVWRVASLSVPAPDAPARIDALSQYEAVQLFVDRALRARPNFQVTNDNAPAVAEICHRLDGIPLAIELAAARVRVLTPEQIREGLEDRFRLLTGGGRTVLPRQQTLQASVDWSYDLLGEQERLLLNRLAVFAGGFTLDAAEGVCAGDRIEQPDILELLSRLVDRSLVQMEEPKGTAARFRLLETIRQYGVRKLTESNDTEAMRDRHLDFYVRWIEDLEPELNGPGLVRALSSVDADEDNIRAAMDWSVSRDPSRGLRFVWPIFRYWFVRGRYTEARTRIETLASADVDRSVLAKASAAAAILIEQLFDIPAAIDFASQAITIGREVGDKKTTLFALAMRAGMRTFSDSEAARVDAEESYELARREGDPLDVVRSVFDLGLVEYSAGRLSEARKLLSQAAELLETGRDHFLERFLLMWLAYVTVSQGRLVDTEHLVAKGIDICGQLQDELYLGLHTTALAWARLLQGRWGETEDLLQQAEEIRDRLNAIPVAPLAGLVRGWLELVRANLPLARARLEEANQIFELALPSWTWHTEVLLADLAEAEGDDESARQLREQAVGAARRSSNPHALGWALRSMARSCRAEGDLADAERKAREALHEFARIESVWDSVEVIEALGGLVAQQESHEEAARLFGAAEALRQKNDFVRFPIRATEYEADLDAVRSALESEVFERAWAEGAALTLDEAVAYGSKGRGPRKRPLTGWPSLTPAELSVVRLVAQGLTNPEVAKRLFISARTVQTHLTHVFDKLGMTSRSELAAEAARRQV